MLSHPNILKLVGVQEDAKTGQIVTVSEWMEHGTVMQYIESHHANRLELVRGLTLPSLPLLKRDNSYSGQPRV